MLVPQVPMDLAPLFSLNDLSERDTVDRDVFVYHAVDFRGYFDR